ncbi:hypothetical protein EHS25_009301 [Saitozyma podzolica]|uniref:Fe2OG dioxygenase domain-containing protein n=1 Tax=Saitozyma podzolica TaxID=1890683 RepID=A0A427YLK7_9TREE|nr:hypothetical protein EHS25_009301 [Saitozyma podzolica]
MSPDNSLIPIIDFADFGDGSSRAAKDIGKRSYAACRDVGFAYLINHGVPQSKVEGMFALSKAFFSLPYETKMKAPHPPQGISTGRGYSGVGVEQVSQMVFDEKELAEIRKASPDFKESYDMGNDESKGCPNVWLEDEALQVKALKALALGMEHVPADFFEDYHTDEDNQLRLLHYPAAPRTVFERGEKGRIGAHTDFSTCTFLFQDDVGGLEVEDPRSPGQFIPAPPVTGAVIFNIGDFLMRWSNDDLKSTLHRVRAPPRAQNNNIDTGPDEMVPERFSIPYFCGANVDRTIDCLPGTWSEDKPKKYSPITAGQYVDMRLNTTYA